MHLILGIIFCFVTGFTFWFIGHVIIKQLNVCKEENQLLSNLLKTCLGTSCFLIAINLFGNIIKDFNWALIISFLLILSVIFWQLNDFKSVIISLKNFFKKDNLQSFFKSYTDKYFWILFGVINFIYGLTAFSTSKLDRFTPGGGHIYNINQLLIGNYPPKYSFLPNIPQRYHYGSDIFGALLSKLSGLNPEISLDVLTLVFLNLSLLALYALTIKFLNTNPVNKYLVPFVAFLGWGPITLLFKTNPGEVIPTKFLDKVIYLTQTRLIDAANWSGLTLNWFFAPPAGFSVFFFLIGLYLLFKFFNDERNIKFTLLLSVFISSLVIIDFTKLILLFSGILVYLLFAIPIAGIDELSPSEETNIRDLLKNIGILFLCVIVLGFIHGNWLNINKNYLPLISSFKLGTSNIDQNFSPLKTNIFLLFIYGFGFYQAWKSNQRWIIFLIPYCVVSLIIPYFAIVPSTGPGKILMPGNLLCAFTLPFALDFIQSYFKFNNRQTIALYSTVLIIISFSTLLFWGFGDKEKPLFRLENNSLKYSGLQALISSTKQIPSPEESIFINYLKTAGRRDEAIVSEGKYAELFTTNTSLYHLFPPSYISDYPIKIEMLEKYHSLSFLLDNKFLLAQKISWLYLTPELFRYIWAPQTRERFLDAYLNKGINLAVSNKTTDPLFIKELYKIDSHLLQNKPNRNSTASIEELLKSNDGKTPFYIKQIALCPYLGIYNSKSNDFDGDKIADIAFFDPQNLRWYIVHGKDLNESQFNLASSLHLNHNGSDLLIPIPADYDGDSKTDIALFNRSEGTWHILNSSNSTEKNQVWCKPLGEVPIPADTDGDSKSDYSCYDSVKNGAWPDLISSTNEYRSHTFGITSTDIPAHIDIDGDKKADYAIYRSNQTIFEVYLSSLNFDSSKVIKLSLGDVTSRVVPEDYDGDGKVDLATWTPEGGKWEIIYAKDLLSMTINPTAAGQPFIGCGIPQEGSTTNTVCSKHTVLLGSAGDIPMPGDYDGDGKAEIGIYHLETAELEIPLSTGIIKKIDLSKYKNYTLASFIGI